MIKTPTFPTISDDFRDTFLLRPVRYAIIATHSLREALANLEDRLEEYAESQPQRGQAKAKVKRAKRKAKA